MKLIFIGFMGSGKSSVAHYIASKLNLPLIEMDKEIEKKAGKSIKELFAEDGETAFRQMEINLAEELKAQNHVIISTGGGVVMNKIILDYLKEQEGKVIFLDTSFETLSQRLQHDSSRPLFQDREKAKELYEFRLPLYQHYSDIQLKTDKKTIEDIALEIMNRIHTL